MKVITPYDYQQAAKKIGCRVETVKAVTTVEAPLGCYDAADRLTILFEPYVFYKQLRAEGIDTKPYLQNAKYSNIISSVWNPKLYGRYSEQYAKLALAKTIDADCAVMSASYGMFQIMGFNHEACGFADPYTMVEILTHGGEPANLEAFIRYIKTNQLDDEMRNRDAKGFARGYNGPSYWKNQYDSKLLKAGF